MILFGLPTTFFHRILHLVLWWWSRKWFHNCTCYQYNFFRIFTFQKCSEFGVFGWVLIFCFILDYCINYACCSDPIFHKIQISISLYPRRQNNLYFTLTFISGSLLTSEFKSSTFLNFFTDEHSDLESQMFSLVHALDNWV